MTLRAHLHRRLIVRLKWPRRLARIVPTREFEFEGFAMTFLKYIGVMKINGHDQEANTSIDHVRNIVSETLSGLTFDQLPFTAMSPIKGKFVGYRPKLSRTQPPSFICQHFDITHDRACGRTAIIREAQAHQHMPLFAETCIYRYQPQVWSILRSLCFSRLPKSKYDTGKGQDSYQQTAQRPDSGKCFRANAHNSNAFRASRVCRDATILRCITEHRPPGHKINPEKLGNCCNYTNNRDDCRHNHEGPCCILQTHVFPHRSINVQKVSASLLESKFFRKYAL